MKKILTVLLSAMMICSMIIPVSANNPHEPQQPQQQTVTITVSYYVSIDGEKYISGASVPAAYFSPKLCESQITLSRKEAEDLKSSAALSGEILEKAASAATILSYLGANISWRVVKYESSDGYHCDGIVIAEEIPEEELPNAPVIDEESDPLPEESDPEEEQEESKEESSEPVEESSQPQEESSEPEQEESKDVDEESSQPEESSEESENSELSKVEQEDSEESQEESGPGEEDSKPVVDEEEDSKPAEDSEPTEEESEPAEEESSTPVIEESSEPVIDESSEVVEEVDEPEESEPEESSVPEEVNSTPIIEIDETVPEADPEESTVIEESKITTEPEEEEIKQPAESENSEPQEESAAPVQEVPAEESSNIIQDNNIQEDTAQAAAEPESEPEEEEEITLSIPEQEYVEETNIDSEGAVVEEEEISSDEVPLGVGYIGDGSCFIHIIMAIVALIYSVLFILLFLVLTGDPAVIALNILSLIAFIIEVILLCQLGCFLDVLVFSLSFVLIEFLIAMNYTRVEHQKLKNKD